MIEITVTIRSGSMDAAMDMLEWINDSAHERWAENVAPTTIVRDDDGGRCEFCAVEPKNEEEER
jgi:hypothetical protein